MVLTILTVAVSRFDFGSANTFVALIVATIKGSLVVGFFMHLRYDNRLYTIILLASLLFVSIFFTPTLIDLHTRDALDPIKGAPCTSCRKRSPSRCRLRPPPRWRHRRPLLLRRACRPRLLPCRPRLLRPLLLLPRPLLLLPPRPLPGAAPAAPACTSCRLGSPRLSSRSPVSLRSAPQCVSVSPAALASSGRRS